MVSGKRSTRISGLLPITTYYYRMYTVEKLGSAYGNEKSFTTLAATPTPVCEADSVEAFPKTLRLTKEESDNITVTVAGSEGCPVVSETVAAKIASGKKRISISPQSADTDTSGQAIFTITATKKAGNARIKFETASGLKAAVIVKVRKE
ncbi:MAG: hypothetical protein CV087_16425 [Candidatus Brocadia sp. WS118]|nr:MAG: hypothetical protein CV087_16425 [Candidatus Brocadia sp. WS118]